jgi:hypothetical protein
MDQTESPVVRTPREWEAQTAFLIAAVFAAALLGILLLVTYIALRAFVLDGGVNGMSPLVSWVVDNWDAVTIVFLLISFGYLGAFYWWRHRTKELLRRVGDPTGNATVNWLVQAWYLALGASFTLGLAGSGSTSGDDERLLFGAVQMGLRLVGLACLLIAVWQIREQVRAQVIRSGVILSVPRRAAVPLSIGVLSAPAVAVEQPADDDFWARVASFGPGIALLETTDSTARRWLLVPADGDLTAIRAALPAGAVVTAFPTPPSATFDPPTADDYYGFLEDEASGALWYQSVKPNRVEAFLARARRARRWGLYATTDPDAVQAIVR